MIRWMFKAVFWRVILESMVANPVTKGIRAILILFTALAFVCQPALAQTGGRVVLLPLDLSRFPKISFLMEAYRSNGQFDANLSANDLLLIEDGAARPVEQFSRLQSGLDLVVAFNTAPSLGYASGSSTPLEQVRKTLLDWCARQTGATQDEFSLVSNSGGQVTKVSNSAQWSAALRDFSPDLQKVQSSLTSLTQAFDLVTDAGRRTASKRAVLWITPPLADNQLPALPNLADRASQLGARIFIWLVAAPGTGSAETKTQAALADLAQRTGGQYAVFTNASSFPDLESWLQPLRYIYQVEYTSAARASATHRLQVQVRRDEAAPAGAEQRFTLNLQPPNPFFLSPPTRIQLNWLPGSTKNEYNLHPQQVELPIMVEFPDAFRRALAFTRLYVDGQLVNEIRNPAPAGITWSLEGFTSSQRHTIRVEVEDILGFKRASIDTPVEIGVDASPLQAGLDTAFFTSDSLTLPLAGGVLVLVLGGIIAVWAVLHRKAHPKPTRVVHTWERPRLSSPQVHPRRISQTQDAPARLIRLTPEGQALPANSIPLPRQELKVGSDPKKVDVVVESNTIDGIHARIQPNGEQDYIIWDTGSLAGTWVNEAPVSAKGTQLQHGDLVHLGREAYRFEQKNPHQLFYLQVSRLEKDPNP